MPYAFKLCLLEITSNDELRRDHLESFSSTIKNISPLPQYLYLPNLAWWWLTLGAPTNKVIWPFDHVVCWTTWQTKDVPLLSECAKRGKIVTDHDWFLLMKSRYTLIMWSWKIMWEFRIIIPPLPKPLGPPNMAGWWLTLGSYP